MTPPRARAEIPAIALSEKAAAASLDCSPTFFAEHIRPELRSIRRGAKVLFPVSELVTWCDRNAEHVLDTHVGER